MIRSYIVPAPEGRSRGGYVLPSGLWVSRRPWSANSTIRSWAAIVSRLLTEQSRVGVNGMYLEFENVADLEVPVVVPSYDRTIENGVAYYDSLAGSESRDYLRVPLTAANVESSDETLYPDGNISTFFAQSSGTVGMHGKPFGATSNSVVFGAALVAMYDQGDATQDLVLSRVYYQESEQLDKRDGSQIGVEWEFKLR
jgi:hypothetical protein